MSAYDAFDVLANLWFLNVPLDLENYEEGAHGGLHSRVEYAAEILRHRSNRRGTDLDRSAIPNPVVQGWSTKIDRLFDLQIFGGHGRETEGAADELREVQGSLEIQELFIRARAFVPQERQTVAELLSGPSASDLARLFGFDGTHAIRLVDAIGSIQEERLETWRSNTRGVLDRLKEELRAIQEGGHPCDELPPEVVARLRTATPDDSLLGMLAIAQTWAGIGSRLQFNAADLAEKAKLDLPTVNAFLTYFSVPFLAEGEAELPRVNGLLRERPLIHDDAGNHFCVSVATLLWAIRPRLERDLKPGHAGEEAWRRYKDHRAAIVERRAVEAVQRVLRAPITFRNVSYSLGGRRYEVDGLVSVDALLIIIEAKSATVRGSSREGHAGHLLEDLRELVGKAASQTSRLQTLVQQGGRLTFTDQKGRKVGTLRCDKVKHVFSLAVTLDDLNWLSSGLWKVFDVGLISAAPPLLFNLHDLEVICDLAEPPSLMPHFLQRRALLAERRIFHASDELDYFMLYLNQGLRMDEFEGERPDIVHIGNQTDALEAYYWSLEGLRSPAPKPCRELPPEIQRIFRFLDRKRPVGFVSASMMLLDMREETLEKIESLLCQIRLRSADGRLHDFSMLSGGHGITVMTAPRSQRGMLVRKLDCHCQLKKYETKSCAWLGLGILDGEPGAFHVYMWNGGEWKADEQMDNALSALGRTLLDR